MSRMCRFHEGRSWVILERRGAYSTAQATASALATSRPTEAQDAHHSTVRGSKTAGSYLPTLPFHSLIGYRLGCSSYHAGILSHERASVSWALANRTEQTPPTG